MKLRIGASQGGPIKAVSLLCLSALALLVLSVGSAQAAPIAPTMLSATNVTYQSAQGEADLKNATYGWFFEVSTNGVDWAQHGPTQAPVGGDHIGKAEIPFLDPGTHYFVRAVNSNFGENTPSANSVEIDTLPVEAPKVLSIDNASSVSYTSVHVSGQIERPANADPAFDTSCFFDYVTDEQFTSNGFVGAGEVECEGSPFKTGGQPTVAANIANLAHSTKYHLRLRVLNSGGQDVKEAASTFTTLAVTPGKAISVNNATNISYSGASFSGEVERPTNANSAFEISCGFEVVTDEQFQLTGFEFPSGGAPCEQSSFAPGVPTKVTGRNGTILGYDNMAYGTTYHLRLSVYNLGGVDRKIAAATFTTLPQPPPPALTITAPTALTSRTAHIEGTVNAGGTDLLQEASYRFECTPECPATGGTSLSGTLYPPENAPRTVSANLRLKANTAYEIKLIAHNYGGPEYAGIEVSTAPLSFKSPIEVKATTGSASVTTTTAGISGQVDPSGDITSYHFEYGPTSALGQSTTTKTIPASDLTSAVSANLTGLEPGTEYHYVLIASNSSGTSTGADRTFTTAATPSGEENCPNAKVREQQKSTFLPECRAYEMVTSPNNELGDVLRVPQVEDNGNAAAWLTTTPGSEVSSNTLVSTGIGRRTPTGWIQEDANPKPVSPTVGLNITFPNLFSTDFRNVVITTPVRSNPEDTTETSDLYNIKVGSGGSGSWLSRPGHLVCCGGYIGASADLQHVVYSGAGGTPIWMTTDGSVQEEVSIDSEGNPVSPSPLAAAQPTNNPVSENGRYVFFSNNVNGAIEMRDMVADKTIVVSASQRTGEVGKIGSVRFLGASPDAEVAYFTSTDQLTDAATKYGGLYRFNTVSKVLTQISGATSWPEGIQINEWQIPKQDNSRFYFTSPHAVAPGAEEGQIGATQNVYVVNGDTTSWVTTVPSGVSLARVSRDGRYMLMTTTASIDGAPNNRRFAIYEYDDSGSGISCVSCRPNGSKNLGSASLAGVPFGWPNCCISARNITDDGSVFFTTRDQLVAGDETASLDVYLYSHGKLALMSSGKGDKDSYIGDNTDDGKNLFIMTRSALVPQDEDAEEHDVYDVRVDGGFFIQPSAGDLCQGEACRTNPSSPPAATPPATPSFIGADNSQSGRNQARKKKNKNKGKKHKGNGKKSKGKRHSNGGRAAR